MKVMLMTKKEVALKEDKDYSSYRAITYIGKNSGIVMSVNKKHYEFEWQKSRGIGARFDEVDINSALKLSKKKDHRGKKIFRLE
jgi:hypothetical protein